MKADTKKWFTLLETIIVVIIVGILLTITLWIGSIYLRTVKYRYEKEQFIGEMDKIIASVRTSNYRSWETYDYLSLQLTSNGLQAYLETGLTAVETLTITESTLVISGGSTTIRLFPYNIACAEWTNYSEVNGVIYVEDPIVITFTGDATYTSQETCYQLDLRLCKLQQIPCSG